MVLNVHRNHKAYEGQQHTTDSLEAWPCPQNMVLNVHRNHKAYEGRREGGEGGMEVGDEGGRLRTYRYAVTTRMIPALRWAAMRAILMFR